MATVTLCSTSCLLTAYCRCHKTKNNIYIQNITVVIQWQVLLGQSSQSENYNVVSISTMYRPTVQLFFLRVFPPPTPPGRRKQPLFLDSISVTIWSLVSNDPFLRSKCFSWGGKWAYLPKQQLVDVTLDIMYISKLQHYFTFGEKTLANNDNNKYYYIKSVNGLLFFLSKIF